MPAVLASAVSDDTSSRMTCDRPRCAASVRGRSVAGSYVQRPARSTPNRANASSMMSSNSPASSRLPLTFAAIRLSVGACQVGWRLMGSPRGPRRGCAAAGRLRPALRHWTYLAKVRSGAFRGDSPSVPEGDGREPTEAGQGSRSPTESMTTSATPRSCAEPTPLRTPMTSPAPAARAIATSGVSPTTATCSGSVRNAWQTAMTGSVPV